jgi:ankyrin repeat protein
MELIRPTVEELSANRTCRGADVWATLTAARDGDVGRIQILLEQDAALVRAEFWYTQPIHFAVREGHRAAVQALLDAGADPTAIRYGGEDLVLVARDRGHEEVAQLIEGVRRQRFGSTPAAHEIHTAAKNGELEKVRALVEADAAAVSLRDPHGSTPLHHAVRSGQLELVGFLLDRGADIAAVSGEGGTYHAAGFSPLDLAIWDNSFFSARNDWRMAGYLLARGAEYSVVVAAAAGDFPRVRRLLQDDPAAVNRAQPCGRCALSAAVESGHEEIARYLLEHGADPNLPEGRFAPRGVALHAAARTHNYEMAKLLLEHGADPAGYIDSCGEVWHVADRETRLLLYQYGLRTDEFDLENYDALAIYADKDPEGLGRAGCGGVFAMVVTQCDDARGEELLRMLLAKGVRVPSVLTGCRSYLWHKPKFTRILLENGMDPNLPNWQHVTPLHNLCGRDGRGRADANRVELADLFLEFGADLNARDEEYRSTPLGWAARNGLEDMAQLLLARGALTSQPDDEPWATPLAWARKRGHAEIVELLKSHGATA